MKEVSNIKEIVSLKDDRIQLARSLNSLKVRIEKDKFLIEGKEAIEWAIDSDIAIDYILVSNKQCHLVEKYQTYDVYQVSEGLLKKATDTNYVIPIIAVGNRKKEIVNTDFCIVLDNLNDFGNIGTIIRTSHAFGIQTLISTKSDFDLFHRKTIDASRGRVFNTQLMTFQSPIDTVKYLRSHNFQIVTTSPHGTQLQSMVKLADMPVALVVGNETFGASEELIENADYIVQIPMYSEVESLNVGVATGISIYELKLKRILGMIEKSIKSTLGRDINVAAMLIREVIDKELKKISFLSSNQLVFMMVLKCDGTISLNDSQKQFGIPDNEIDAHFQPLIKNKLIAIDANNNYLLTESGAETIGKLWTIIENAEKEILADFTDYQKQELKSLLQKVISKCDQIIQQK